MLKLLPTAWVRSKVKRWPLYLGDKSATRRSVNTGLTRHSAITKGSFPRASNSSRRTSGCFVSRAHAVHLGSELLRSDRLLPSKLPALASRADNLLPSFQSARPTSPHRARAWENDFPPARCYGASKRPRLPVDRLPVLRTSAFGSFGSRSPRRGRQPHMKKGAWLRYCEERNH